MQNSQHADNGMDLKMTRYAWLLLAFLSIAQNSSEQILEDTHSFERIRKGVISIYNCDFREAKEVSNFLDEKYPNSSLSWLFKGMMLYWQYFPIIPGTENSKLFEDYLHKGMDLAEAKLKTNETDAENLLSGLGSAGLLLLYYADNGESSRVMSIAPKTYQWVMKAFDFTHTYKDFYFITGLYNYYREAYTDAHPIYKPVLVFFPHGNKRLGLKELKIASDSAIFLMAESINFLSGIYQSFEKDPAQAVAYSKKLKDKFEKNLQFRLGYIRDLLIIKKYGEAESLLNSIPYKTVNDFFQAQVDIFRAIIQEKKYNEADTAEQLYETGVRKAQPYGPFGEELISYAYFGLSRINVLKGNHKLAKQYRKKAKDLSSYDHLNFDH